MSNVVRDLNALRDRFVRSSLLNVEPSRAIYWIVLKHIFEKTQEFDSVPLGWSEIGEELFLTNRRVREAIRMLIDAGLVSEFEPESLRKAFSYAIDWPPVI